MTNFIKQTNACNGQRFTGPFENETSARKWWSRHQTTNIRMEVVDSSELPTLYGAASQGLNGVSAASWNSLFEFDHVVTELEIS